MSIPVSDRPLRQDAERNRERIISAARDAFAESGIDATMEEVARRAGVGIGTLYRRFPDKEALIDAVFEETLRELGEMAREALEEPDAWRGFTAYLECAMALNAANRGLHAVIGSQQHGRNRLAAVKARMRPLVGRLVSRAQEEGTLRPDFSPADLPLVFASVGRVIELTKDEDPELWRRYLGLLLDGLRAEGATPLPRPPLRPAQLNRLGAARLRRSHA
jgi:AcrR family transcriptional regulator